MYSRQHRTSKSPGNDSDAPRTNQFAPRPFVVQPQTEEVKPQEDQTADLQTKAEKFKEIDDGFPDPAIFTRHLTPPKRPRVQMKLNIARTHDKHEEEAIETQSLRESGELSADASNSGNKETIQRACTECESEISPQPQTKDADNTFDKGALYAQSDAAMQRGNKLPNHKKPDENNCLKILHDILVLLVGNGNHLLLKRLSVPKGQDPTLVTKGQPVRYAQMKRDTELYRNYRSNPKPGVGSWYGHRDIYNEQQRVLKQLVKSWRDDNCNNLDKIPTIDKETIKAMIENADKWAETDAPKTPDNVDKFELPQNDLPAFNFNALEFIGAIFRLLGIGWGKEQGV